MARKGAILLLLSSFALGPWETPRAAETSPSLLSKLGMRRRTEAAVYAAVLAERKSTNPRP